MFKSVSTNIQITGTRTHSPHIKYTKWGRKVSREHVFKFSQPNGDSPLEQHSILPEMHQNPSFLASNRFAKDATIKLKPAKTMV